MPNIELRDCQYEALGKMKNGCILCGGVGSGKSRTGLAYYYICNGGRLNRADILKKETFKDYVQLTFEQRLMTDPIDLYIITTAKKRDTLEWNKELVPFLLSPDPGYSGYSNKVIIDSWNNIKKYTDVTNAFFIFDEQRVVGKGAWVKSFLKIAKNNQWILLSATPGDTWSDYIPVFIANGFYKNRTDFGRQHIVWKNMRGYWSVDYYINEGRLIRYRNDILIPIHYHNKNALHHIDVFVNYDKESYMDVVKRRWNYFENKPIENPSEYCSLLRRVVNSDISRQTALLEIIEDHPKSIVFYNYDFELDILKDLFVGTGIVVKEWNGHKHEDVPDGDTWVYLVQYSAGNEGWNCITTDTIIFYSQNYSYRIMTQAAGRIDRLNTPFKDLYFYHLRSRSGIDLALSLIHI